MMDGDEQQGSPTAAVAATTETSHRLHAATAAAAAITSKRASIVQDEAVGVY